MHAEQEESRQTYFQRQSQLYNCQCIRTWAGLRLWQIFFYYCVCQSKAKTRLKPEWPSNWAIMMWWKYCNHHSWCHHTRSVPKSNLLLTQANPETQSRFSDFSQPARCMALIMYKTDQSLSKSRLILGVISNSIRLWTLGIESWIHITDLSRCMKEATGLKISLRIFVDTWRCLVCPVIWLCLLIAWCIFIYC